jgi:hypothetical protein
MRFIASVLAAMLGSTLGGAIRVGLESAEHQVKGEPMDENIVVGGSLTAALAGGVIGSFLGVRRAFWLGAVFGAAGAARFDAMILGRFGIDTDALMAKATEAAGRAKAAAQARRGGEDAEATEGEDAA